MLKVIALAAAAAFALPLAAAAAPAPSTSDYMMQAGQSDQFEIQAGRLAQSNGSSSAVKRFGKEMVTDHTKSTKMIMAAAMKSGMPTSPPPSLTPDQQSMLSDLSGKHGKDFDASYIAGQKTAHQQALALHQSYASGGSDPNFKAAANKIVPVVQMHIDMLQKMGG